MPIRINLLAEAQAMEEARRRDPVKRAIWMAGLVIVVMLGWGGFEFSNTMMAKSEKQKQERVWKDIETNFFNVSISETNALKIGAKLSSLTRLSTNRFLWGTVLNGLQQVGVPHVQFIRISGVQNYAIGDKPAGRPGASPIKGALAVESISISIEAKDFGTSSEKNYQKLTDAILKVPFFKTNLTPADITLKSISTAPTVEVDNKPFTTFILECKFPDRKREE